MSDIDQEVELAIKRLEEGNFFENPQLSREVFKNELAKRISSEKNQKLEKKMIEVQGDIKNLQSQLVNEKNKTADMQVEIKRLESQLARENNVKLDMQNEIKHLQSQVAVGNKEKLDMQIEIKHLQSQVAVGNKEKLDMQNEIKHLQSQVAVGNKNTAIMQVEMEHLKSKLAKENKDMEALHENMEANNKTMRKLTKASPRETYYEIPENPYAEVDDTTRRQQQMYNERNNQYDGSRTRSNLPQTQVPVLGYERGTAISASNNTNLSGITNTPLPVAPEESLGNHHRHIQVQDDHPSIRSPESTSDEISTTSFSSSTYDGTECNETAKVDKTKRN